MTTSQAQALTEMMEAVNAGDASRYARLYAPEATIVLHGSGTLVGRDAIERHEVELMTEFPGTRLGFYDLWQDGAIACARYAVRGQTRDRTPMGHEGLLFYRFQPAGLIDEECRYMDSLTPMAQLGMLEVAAARPLPKLPTSLKSHVASHSAHERENVAIVAASLAALDATHAAALLAAFDGEAMIDEMIDPEPYFGARSVREWYEKWTTAAPDAVTEITTILGVGAFVLLESIVRGTLRAPLGPVQAADRPFEIHRAAIARMRHGKIAQLAAFMNGQELAQAMGQWPPSGARRI